MPDAFGPSGAAGEPRKVGPYELLMPIGHGGMATVYLARRADVACPRDVALKLTHAHLREAPGFVDDLVEEAALAVQIAHPHVVSVLDVGRAASDAYLVMALVEGGTLAALTRAAEPVGLPVAIGLRILLDALAGLHAAHELSAPDGSPAGLVHRDFSPQNILVGVDGLARLTDFGVAKAATRVSHTATGVVKGKVTYMSPEQARGRAVDRRCDVWAAGVVAWEILTGQRMRGREENEAVALLKTVTEPPPRAAAIKADVPTELDEVVAGALEMDVSLRCPDASTFARRLVAASRASGVRIAEPSEVASHVEALLGGEIVARRQATVATLAARAAAPGSDVALEPAGDDAETYASPTRVREPSSPTPPAGHALVAAAPADVTVTVASATPARASRDRIASVAAGVLTVGAVFFTWRMLQSDAPARAAAQEPVQTPVARLLASAATGAESRAPGDSPPKRFEISSSAPLVEVVVGGRAATVPAGATQLVVDVAPDEVARGVDVEATSVAGRRVALKAPAGALLVAIAFPADPQPAVGPSDRPRPAEPRADRPHGVPARAAATQQPALADSPYEPKAR